uniref:methylated-DNA--[protein]-cysteine S-methyltransferase n=1 Tax=uncultured bacterium BLR8 TaxID=506524 RepID=C0IN85_9BACT|nr:methylated-DNA--protein-cysteine methyltransferase [uncultured bacterium BLR8]
MFREITGLTPRQYADAHRARRLRDVLQDGATSVTDAAFAAGFGSSAGLHAASGRALGMTPSAFQRGGKGMQIQYAFGHGSLGSVLVARSARGLCAILMDEDRDALVNELQRRFPNAVLHAAAAGFTQLLQQVLTLIEHPAGDFQLPLDLRGTAFQLRVWQALREIPAGRTVTYGELARRIGAPRAVRAVARACGANHVAVVVPCHRVIGADGTLTGYRWGKEKKRTLLARESKEAHAPARKARAG